MLPLNNPRSISVPIHDRSEASRLANPWNNRSASIAIVIALLVGIVGALSLSSRSPVSEVESQSLEGQSNPAIQWRTPVAFGTNLPALGDNILYVAKALKTATEGRIRLDVYEPGMLVPAFSITESVRDGKLEAGYTWLGYDQGRIPATPLIAAVPFGMEPWEYSAWYFEAGGKALVENLYEPHNVHPILCGLIGPETAGWFTFPIVRLEDFEGLKIRFAGLGGRVLQQLGASVTLIPGGEIYQALEKGAIDATEFSLPNVDQRLGFADVAKYNYFPGWHQTFTAFHLVVNRDTWTQLPLSDQSLIELACTAGVTRNLARGEALQGAVIEGFGPLGVTPVRFSRDLLKSLQRVSHEVLQAEADKDEDFAVIWASQREFLETYGTWKSFAYLPRDFDQMADEE
jgi:TRAP-type mannitol/chloroaromatic compound transport system substrate-binding protein